MVVVTSDPFGWVSVLTSVFLTMGVGMTSLASRLSGVTAGTRPASLCEWSLSTDDDTGTDLFGFLGTTGWSEEEKRREMFKLLHLQHMSLQICFTWDQWANRDLTDVSWKHFWKWRHLLKRLMDDVLWAQWLRDIFHKKKR